MDLILLLIIGFSSMILLFMATTGSYAYKYYWLMLKTPAKSFKLAKKKGKSIMIAYGDNGIANFEVSKEKDILMDKEKLVNIAPKSVFIEAKSRIAITSYLNSAGLSGQTLSPLFVALTQKIEQGLNNPKDPENPLTKREALLNAIDIQEEEAKAKKDKNQLLSLEHLKSYLNYNDAVGNYNTAHRIASVMFRKGVSDILKFIALLIGSAIAGAIILGAIYFFMKGFQAPPDVIIKGAEFVVQNASNIVSGTPVNASVVMP